ncbi:unnamed protein product [Toxocara canis]|uniref:Protein kinase domain-containing protein n=1 Tax=Toxocara canis TaxID=6265 RepID=A0A183UPA1_TOXCA|nr:unnamed protein product [Toxocara canis]
MFFEHELIIESKVSCTCQAHAVCFTRDERFASGYDYRYTILSLIGSGGFGDVYRVKRVKKIKGQTNTYALKTETIDFDNKNLNRLKIEMTVLQLCNKQQPERRQHFVSMVDKGRTEEFKFIIMDLVGTSIDIIQREMPNHSFSFGTSAKLGLQTIDAIADLHEIGYLHRDIKPQNFSVGVKDKASTIYLLDFGIARKFTIKDTKAVRLPRESVRFMGTVRYASRHCHLSKEQSRRDDLESWMYMLLEFFDYKALPWAKSINRTHVCDEKVKLFSGDFPKSVAVLPQKIHKIISYIDSLEYSNEPDYDFIKTMIRQSARKQNADINAKYDWQPDTPNDTAS